MLYKGHLVEKIVIFGTGNAGRAIYRAFKDGYKIVAFIDNNKDIHVDDKNLTKITYINIYENKKGLTEEGYNTLEDEEKVKYRKCVEYNKDAVREAKKNIYYLNSKVVYFKNNIDNNHYKKYFKNVIMKYLMQVIPSTTILILQGFEENE